MIYTNKNSSTLYNLVLKSVLKHYKESNSLKKISHKVIDYFIFDKYLIYAVFIIFLNYLKNILNPFSKNPFYIFKVKNIEVGKFISTMSMRNIKNNTNFLLFIFNFHKTLLKACFVYASALRASKYAKAIFLGDIFYLDGIWIDFFIEKKNVQIYLKTDPYDLICIDKKYINLSDFLINGLKDFRIDKNSNSKIKNYMRKRLSDPRSAIFYYDVKNVKYSIDKPQSKNLNIIIYSHSFTDEQMRYGYDGFKNVYDWLKYSLNELAKIQNAKIYLKLHPNMYIKETASKIETMDLNVWSFLKRKIPNTIIIIDKTISNLDLLSNFNKKNTILISHHGNALVEGAYLGFRCISSICSVWFDNYSFINLWKNKNDYSLLLRKLSIGQDFLIYPDESINKFISECFLNNYGSYSKRAFAEIIARITGISIKELIRNPNIEVTNSLEKKIILEISSSIYKI